MNEILLVQVGTMVTYILDALRYKEAALGAVWVTLGSMNLLMLLSGAMFAVGRPIILSILLMLMNGATLLLIGDGNPLPSPEQRPPHFELHVQEHGTLAISLEWKSVIVLESLSFHTRAPAT